MKKIIRLTESDLTKLVVTILKEQGDKTYMGEDTVYKYSVIGKYEKDGKKYDLVRYYFTIEDNTNVETETDEPETTKVDKILFKFELMDAIPFNDIKKSGYVKISPTTDIPRDLRKDNVKKTFTYFYSGSEKDLYGQNKRYKIEEVQFDTTFLVPEGYHFNVGYLDHM
jgi:hypothetical protein